MVRLRSAIPLLALVVGLTVAAPAGGQADCPPARASEAVQLEVRQRPDHALILDATVNLANPASTYLEYGGPDGKWLRTPTASAAERHELPLLRLRAETTYQVRAFALDAAGCPAEFAQAEAVTGMLPEPLRGHSLAVSGQASVPLTLMDWRGTIRRPGRDEVARLLVTLDQAGEVVWYYRLPREVDASPTSGPRIRLQNGNWLYLARMFGMEEVSPDARSVRRFPVSTLGTFPHHDLTQLPDGRILFLGGEEKHVDDDAPGGQRNLRIRADTLHVLDLDSGTSTKVWSAFDSLDPALRLEQWYDRFDEEGKDDWTHANSVALGPRGNVLVSIRHLDQVISLSPDFTTIEWKLGGPDSSFAFPDPTDHFHGQHSAQELPGNRVLLFDNGNFRPDGRYSRGLELELDFSTMTARKVWEYRPSPDVYSNAISNVVRLPNGNTLVNFGFPDTPEDPLLAVEARPDGSPAWVQELSREGQRLSRYQINSVDSLGGEVEVLPTEITER